MIYIYHILQASGGGGRCTRIRKIFSQNRERSVLNLVDISGIGRRDPMRVINGGRRVESKNEKKKIRSVLRRLPQA